MKIMGNEMESMNLKSKRGQSFALIYHRLQMHASDDAKINKSMKWFSGACGLYFL